MEAPTRRESLAAEASRPSLEYEPSRVHHLLSEAGVPPPGNWPSPKTGGTADGLTSAASLPSLGNTHPQLRGEASESGQLPRTASRVRAAAAAMESGAGLAPQGATPATPQRQTSSADGGSRVRATSAHLQALVAKPAPWGVAKGLPSDPPSTARPSDTSPPLPPGAGFRVSAAAAADVPEPSALGGEGARPGPGGTGPPPDGAQLRMLFAAVAVITGALVAAKSTQRSEAHRASASASSQHAEAMSDAQVLAMAHRAELCKAALASHEEEQALYAPPFLCSDPDGGRLPAELRHKLFGPNPPVVRDAHVSTALAARASAAAARRKERLKERLAAPMVAPPRMHVATA